MVVGKRSFFVDTLYIHIEPIKVLGWGGGSGLCDYCVSPSPNWTFSFRNGIGSWGTGIEIRLDHHKTSPGPPVSHTTRGSVEGLDRDSKSQKK